MKKNSCIVVTGANGLAGSAVVDHLRSQLYTCVVGLGREDCDLMDIKATREAFERIRPQYVFHAAACVYGIGGNMKNQGKSFLENTLINTSVIDASSLVGVDRIVVMGTNAIYPRDAALPYHESSIFDGRPHPSESAYGHAKRGMLAMLEAYNESYGMNYCYIVSGNLYGPRDKFDPINGHVLPSMIAKFYEASLDDQKIVALWGNGEPKRDFLFSKDLARIAEMLLGYSARGTINIGSGHTYAIKDVAKKLCDITGVPIDRVWFDRDKPNGRMCCTSDLTRLSVTGFQPEFSLDRGLKETWDWYCGHQQRSAGASVPAH